MKFHWLAHTNTVSHLRVNKTNYITKNIIELDYYTRNKMHLLSLTKVTKTVYISTTRLSKQLFFMEIK